MVPELCSLPSELCLMGTATRLRLPKSAFFDTVRKSGLLPPDDLVAFIAETQLSDETLQDPIKLAALFVRRKYLTKYQAMQLLRGNTQGFILDQYKILDGIRQDRVGMVFLALDRNSRKNVAVKILPTDRSNDPTILNAFLREVRLAARVEHPNVARVLDMNGRQGLYYVVTEYVAEPTLDKTLAANGPLEPNRAAQIAAQVAIALRFAHQQELIHRDIKPSNIAIQADGRVKLIDLGLTHMLENPWKHVTKRIKTKEYADEIDHVAPEQAWGNEPNERSDIYGLGSTLFTLLTGQSPFPGSATEKMADRQVKDVPNPHGLNPNVPVKLGNIVAKMGQREPQKRYATMTELLVDLQEWLPIADWLTIAASLPTTKTAQPPERLIDRVDETNTNGFFGRIRKLFGK
jgi:eukaryotic-like serine/threonine-protein kinase